MHSNSQPVPLRNLVTHYIGGGWGSEEPKKGFDEVLVIRGTDFSDVRLGDVSPCPVRYEKRSKIAQRSARVGDLLIESSGGSPTTGVPVGKPLLVTEELAGEAEHVIPASFCKLLRLNQEVADPAFVYYSMLQLYGTDDIWQFQTPSTGIINMNFEFYLDDFILDLPPLTEQKRIASTLAALDDKVKLNRRTNETLEAMAQTLFQAWFVDFEPVKAKQAATRLGRDPERAAMAALSGKLRVPRDADALTADALDAADAALDALNDAQRQQLAQTAALFPDRLVESELGMIPEGSRLSELKDIAEVEMGASPPGATYNEHGDGVALINGPAQYGVFFLEQTKWTTAPTRLSEFGDLILCVRGSTTGRMAHSDGVYCLGRGVCAIRSRDGSQTFVNRAVEDAMQRLLSKATGSVFPNLSRSAIEGLAVVVPTAATIQSYSRVVKPVREAVWGNFKQLQILTELRDTLLPKLLSGELLAESAEEEVA